MENKRISTRQKLLVSHLGIDSAIINIKDSFEGMLHEVEKKLPGTVSKQTVTNLPARLRMAATLCRRAVYERTGS